MRRPIAIALAIGLAACLSVPAAEAAARRPTRVVRPLVVAKKTAVRSRAPRRGTANPFRRPTVRPLAKLRPVKSSGKPRAGTLGAVAGGAAALARGTAVDGPRHTIRAIKKNPRMFAAGVVLIGVIGAVSHKLGWNSEHVAIGLSATAVLAQARAAWPGLKKARGLERLRLTGSDLIWPIIFFGASTAVGHAIHGETAAGHSPSLRELVTSFFSSAVIGGDAPAVAVTALDTGRGGH